MNRAGLLLRRLREQMGLTTRDVESASAALARKYRNGRYAVPISRLCEIEKTGATPSIYRLYSLAAIYHKDLAYLLHLYGVGVDKSVSESQANSSVAPHPDISAMAVEYQDIAITQQIAFNPRKTRYLGQITGQTCEALRLAYFQQFADGNFTYGYIGSEDWTMYPLLPPRSLVQIDETRNRISSGGWASEYERPIYFVEMRGKHTCCWCTTTPEVIILTPHPLSPVPPRVLQHHDAEVLGQVVGAALVLGRRRCFPDLPPTPYAGMKH